MNGGYFAYMQDWNRKTATNFVITFICPLPIHWNFSLGAYVYAWMDEWENWENRPNQPIDNQFDEQTRIAFDG